MKNYPLALAHLTVIEAHPLELIKAARFGGFDSISLCLAPSKADQIFFPVADDPKLINDIRTCLDDNGVSILDAECIWLTPEKDMNSYERVLEVASSLGAKYALVIANDPDRQRSIDQFRTLCEMARPLGLRMMLEFLPYLSVPSLASATEFLREAEQANSGIMIDALHLFRSGGSAAELAQIDKSLLGYLQLCDAPALAPKFDMLRTEARGERLFPGEGELPLFDLLMALPEDIPLSVEAPSNKHRHLDVFQRAKLCGIETRKMLESFDVFKQESAKRF